MLSIWYDRLRRYRALAIAAFSLGLVFESASRLGLPLTAPTHALVVLAGGDNAFLTSAMVGTFLIAMMLRPTRRELEGSLVSSAVISTLLVVARMAAGHAPKVLDALGVALGVCGLGILLVRVLRSRGPERRHHEISFLGTSILPAFVTLTEPFLEVTAHLHPLTHDGMVYAADGNLGVQPSFLLGRVLMSHQALGTGFEIVYAILPIALASIIGLHLRANTDVDVLGQYVVAGWVAFVLYHAVPVAGPVYAFQDQWPWTEPASATVGYGLMKVKWIARNCVPSMHTTWALFVFWHARTFSRPIRWSAAAFLVLTLIATLGLGFHYVMDLVVALPFAVALHVAFLPSAPLVPGRKFGIVAAAGFITLSWLVLLRYAVPWLLAWPAIHAVLVFATIGSSIGLFRIAVPGLQRAPAPRAITDMPPLTADSSQ